MVTEEQDKSTDPEALGPYGGPRAVSGAPPPPEDPPYEDPIKVLTRAKFLTTVAVVTGGVMTAAILVPVVGFAVTDSLKEEEWRWINIGPMRLFPEGQTSSIAVSGPDPDADRRVFVRRGEGDMQLMWNRCTHLGCPVAYSAGGDNFNCPCHGGAYDSVGLVTAGPPVRPLDRFDWKVVGAGGGEEVASRTDPAGLNGVSPDDELLVGRPYSVDDEFQPYEIKGPGEPVTGVLANLYPIF